MRQKTCVIIEDEIPAILRMKQLLLDYKDSIQLLGEADTGKKAVELIMKKQAEVVFLDIQLPDMTGFDVLSQIGYQPLVVFTTAYSEYALKAFDSYSIDYLVKPIKKERFAQSMQKLSNWGGKTQFDFAALQTMIQQLQKPKQRFSLAIKKKDKIILISYEEIVYFQAEDKYINVYLKNGENHLLSKSLNQLSSELPSQFIRIHRSYIINKTFVSEIQKFFKGKYVLKFANTSHEKITTGETYSHIVKEIFGL